MLAAARCVVYRDLLLALRRRGDVAVALLFFVIVASLFPLGIGADIGRDPLGEHFQVEEPPGKPRPIRRRPPRMRATPG